MAIEKIGQMTYVDEAGNEHLLFPKTKPECIPGVAEHLANNDNPHGVTIAQIGAAPSGFGLGETNGRVCSDCNTAVLPGFYALSGSSCVNYPTVFLNAQYGTMRVERRQSYVLQIVNFAYWSAQRISNDGGATWLNWIDTSPSAFAPAGYGLGGDSTLTVTTLADLDLVTANGTYQFTNSAATLYGINCRWAILRVTNYDSAAVMQELFPTWSTTRLVRVRNANVWGEWEVDNPPMNLGVEYRTTERWNGKVVWTQLIDFGALPNNTQKTKSCATFTQLCESCFTVTDGTYYSDANKEPWITGFNVSSGTILLKTNTDVSAYTATAQLWYVKD